MGKKLSMMGWPGTATMKGSEVVAEPFFVVIMIGPVVALVGIRARRKNGIGYEKGASVPLNLILTTSSRFEPWKTTSVPTGPQVGEKDRREALSITHLTGQTHAEKITDAIDAVRERPDQERHCASHLHPQEKRRYCFRVRQLSELGFGSLCISGRTRSWVSSGARRPVVREPRFFSGYFAAAGVADWVNKLKRPRKEQC